ncbi:MAG TPA: hypothetical protein VGK32_17875 [Vicinamibacterales bacterium]|jgi:hypothetical protein
MLKRTAGLMLVVLVAMFGVACATQKVPAEAAIKAAEQAFDAVKGEATAYAPDQIAGVEEALKSAKDAFAKGDYQAALTAAQAIPEKVTALATAATAKKNELTKGWEGMSAGLPKVVEAIQSRVDILSKAKKLPAGMDKAKFESAKTGLAEVKQNWTAATAAFGGGNLKDAVAKATAVKGKAAEIMGALGMPVPEGLK